MTPYWEAPGVTIYCGDVREFSGDGRPFHAMLTDAPYEQEFMGKDWDASGVAFDPDVWAGLAKHLQPGAFAFAFAGTLNDDLISVAMRKAGLRKYHKGLAWAYASGFPKASRIDTQVDAAAGAERETVGPLDTHRDGHTRTAVTRKHGASYEMGFDANSAAYDRTAPATDLARTWAGHRYGGQALKPAAETLLVFSKPYEGRPVDCITGTGAGALNIDGGRIGTGVDKGEWPTTGRKNPTFNASKQIALTDNASGRWPANLTLCHLETCRRAGTRRVKSDKPGPRNVPCGLRSDTKIFGTAAGLLEVKGYGDAEGLETVEAWECAEGCPVRELGEQSGERPSSMPLGEYGALRDGRENSIYGNGVYSARPNAAPFGDTGTAARFFRNADWAYEIAERIDAAAPVHFCAKASRRERDEGLGALPAQRQQGSLSMPKQKCGTCGGWVRMGVQSALNRPNSTCTCEEPEPGEVSFRERPVRNVHPCVKPVSLCQHYATLLLPPPEYAPRRILIPFAGSGSEALGAILAGWEEVVCVEQSEEYCAIAQARITRALAQPRLAFEAPAQRAVEAASAAQLGLELGLA